MSRMIVSLSFMRDVLCISYVHIVRRSFMLDFVSLMVPNLSHTWFGFFLVTHDIFILELSHFAAFYYP